MHAGSDDGQKCHPRGRDAFAVSLDFILVFLVVVLILTIIATFLLGIIA